MADKKPKRQQFVTPTGVASYPKLLVPDTKFKTDGEFSVKMILTPEVAAEIEKAANVALTAFKEEDLKVLSMEVAKKPKLKPSLKVRTEAGFGISIVDHINDEGEPDGNKQVTFKQSAVIKMKNDDGTQRTINVIIQIFDAKGKKITTHDVNGKLLANAIKIWGGSKLKIAYNIIPGWNEATKSYWATLRPTAVQVIELSTASTRDAADYGFGEEEGFQAPEDESMPQADEVPQGGGNGELPEGPAAGDDGNY